MLPTNELITRAVDQEKLGYRTSKKKQLEIMCGFLHRRDAYILYASYWSRIGKSLCYACLLTQNFTVHE